MPLAAGSVSLRLYPHDDLDAPAVVEELRAQAALAATHGFDGVMTSEHHGGFAGYLPNPLQVAGWALEVMSSGWAAPCPLLLPLRPAALVAEEVAWLAARFPGRVGLGVAAGALPADFEVMGTTMDDLTARFAASLEAVVQLLDGSEPGVLADDRAIQACRVDPVPVVSAAMGFTAVRRAARLGVGVLFDSLSTVERCRALSDAYRAAGGNGACIVVCRTWLGAPPRDDFARQSDVYRSYALTGAQAHWGRDELIGGDDATAVVAAIADRVRRAGCDAVNLRVHVPGVSPHAARGQIEGLGDAVVGPLRARLRS